MRAAILLIPLAALAAVAAGGQEDVPDNDSMELGNAVEMAADAAEAAIGNVTTAAAPRPAWLANGLWLWAGDQAQGPVWYFEAFESDFSVRPFRVLVRVDETPDPARTHNNTERLAEIDCAEHRYRILRTTHRDDAGRASEANERGDGNMVRIAPGSVFEAVAQTVCAHGAQHYGSDSDSR